jgi:hypothetical protein
MGKTKQMNLTEIYIKEVILKEIWRELEEELQLDEALDFENKMIEVNNYTITNKKNALKMPENAADVETIIQQNVPSLVHRDARA